MSSHSLYVGQKISVGSNVEITLTRINSDRASISINTDKGNIIVRGKNPKHKINQKAEYLSCEEMLNISK